MPSLAAHRAPPEELGLSAERLERVRALARGYVDRGLKPCSQVLVARRGKIALVDTYGWADKEKGVPLREDSIFRIFSMTKPITCTAAMILYERGCFQLDDPISRWIPEWGSVRVLTGGTADAPETAPPRAPVTVQHLFTHTAGIVSTIVFNSGGTGSAAVKLWRKAMATPPKDLKEHVERMATVPLVAQPGEKWIYADGHSVLARLVEVWSGQPFDVFLQENLFSPLGMVDTGFVIPEHKRSRLIVNYAYDKVKKIVPFSEHPMGKFMNDGGLLGKPRAMSGSGGLASTMHDYWRFAQMLGNKGELDGVRILGTKTVEFMSMNHLPNNGDLSTMGVSSFTETTMEGVGFGLGVGVCIDAPRRMLMASPGEYFWGGAASTVFWVDPQEELVVIFLTQLVPSGSHPVRPQLRVAVNQAVVGGGSRAAHPAARL